MVTLVLYVDSIGKRSARGIERRCREDVAFRVITANQVPDHAILRIRLKRLVDRADTECQWGALRT